MVRRDSVAGYLRSRRRLKTCAVMTLSASRSPINARYGASSTAGSAVAVTSTKPWWESAKLEPWPGKCLSAVRMPAPCMPRIHAAASAPT